MTPESKKKIRALTKSVPRLIKASLIKQAFELEKIVSATFEFSDEMQSLFQGVPQNYIEVATGIYQEKMYRAYNGGQRAANDAKPKMNLGDDIVKEIRVKMPMSYSLGEDLLASFKSEVDEFLRTVPDRGDIYSQFKKDLESAYLEGAVDFFHSLNEETMGEEPKPEVKSEPESAPEESSEEVESEPSQEAGEENLEQTATASNKEELWKKLEEYAKLLGADWKEDVLRATLGLPAKSPVVASVVAEDVVQSSTVGPYDVGALREKILSTVKSMDLDENDLQVSIVECLVSGLENYSDLELAKVVEQKLDISGSLPEEATRDDVRIAVDVVAQRLNEKMDLPGELHFLEVNGDYCLVFSFEKDRAGELATASLPKAPQGPLSMKDQKEIEALASLKKTASLKEIKTASPRIAAHLGRVLTEVRNSKLGLSEGARVLKSSMEDLVGAVFGDDGKSYFQHVRGR